MTLDRIIADILEHLHELGYDIGYTSVCNHINKKLERRKEAFIRQVYAPGDVCEFDWGEVKLEIGGHMRTLYMAVFTPALSNYRYAACCYTQVCWADRERANRVIVEIIDVLPVSFSVL